MSTNSAAKKAGFHLASERLELALGSVRTITDGGIDGAPIAPELSFGLLRALAIDDLRYHHLIEASFDRLSAFRELPIRWAHGRGMSGLASRPGVWPAHAWSSAHEAAAAVVDMAVGAFFRPLGIEPTSTDPVVRFPNFNDLTDAQKNAFRKLLSEHCRKALTMTAEEVAEWQERIRHERAKLLQGSDGIATKADSGKQPIEPSQESLSDNEYTVLLALRDARPRRLMMIDLEVQTKIGRKVCGAICTALAKRGLADYDSEKRTGAAIAADGERLLALERPLTTR